MNPRMYDPYGKYQKPGALRGCVKVAVLAPVVAVVAFGLFIAAWFGEAWGIMLLIGNLHGWTSAVPLMSWNSATSVALPVVVFSIFGAGVAGALKAGD